MTGMVVLDRLTKRFGDLLAVDDISLSVQKGEVLGFLGPNAAGKSTTMKMVTGFLPPTAGTARVEGYDVVTDPVAVKQRLGYLPEGAPAYGEMTPAAFLDFIARVRGYDGRERTRRIHQTVEQVRLGDVMQQPIETLSKGFKRRVGLAQALLHDPQVLILDEPTDGLDPNQKHHVRSLIREMASEKAIIISTHILEEVEAVCTRAVIIAQGRLVADGTAQELLNRLPDHNAVTLVVAEAQAVPLRSKLYALERVPGIKIDDPLDGRVRMTVLCKDNQPLLNEINQLLRQEQINVDEIAVIPGRLDDVFRQVTTDLPGQSGTVSTGGQPS